MTDSNNEPRVPVLLQCPLHRVRAGAKQRNEAGPSRRRRLLICLFYATVCHSLFAASVLAMIGMMYFGMSSTFGSVPTPYAYLANFILLMQFALGHSFLLSTRGRAFLSKLAPYG